MNTRANTMIRLFFAAIVATVVGACATAPSSVQDRSELRRDADNALTLARTSDNTFGGILQRSAGYAVFPNVGKGGAGIGGAYGRGIVYQNGQQIGFTDLSQVTVGLQLGGQSYTQILVFENAHVLDTFRQGNFEFSSQATAVALRSGDGANAEFTDGVAVYTMDEAGLMFEAAVGGQKFSYQAFAR
jgi:lipid-binding SYLF domain-containing protein